MDYQINLTKIVDSIMAKKFLIIFTTIIAGVIAIILMWNSTQDLYAATSTIYAASEHSYVEAREGMNILADYMDVARSYKVAEHASTLMQNPVSPEVIQSSVAISTNENSSIITILVTHNNPSRTVEISNAVAEAFVEETNQLSESESVQILDKAREPIVLVNGRMQSMMMIAVVTIGAFAVVVGIIVLLALFDTRVAYVSELTLGGKYELVGVIPSKPKAKSKAKQ